MDKGDDKEKEENLSDDDFGGFTEVPVDVQIQQDQNTNKENSNPEQIIEQQAHIVQDHEEKNTRDIKEDDDDFGDFEEPQNIQPPQQTCQQSTEMNYEAKELEGKEIESKNNPLEVDRGDEIPVCDPLLNITTEIEKPADCGERALEDSSKVSAEIPLDSKLVDQHVSEEHPAIARELMTNQKHNENSNKEDDEFGDFAATDAQVIIPASDEKNSAAKAHNTSVHNELISENQCLEPAEKESFQAQPDKNNPPGEEQEAFTNQQSQNEDERIGKIETSKTGSNNDLATNTSPILNEKLILEEGECSDKVQSTNEESTHLENYVYKTTLMNENELRQPRDDEKQKEEEYFWEAVQSNKPDEKEESAPELEPVNSADPNENRESQGQDIPQVSNADPSENLESQGQDIPHISAEVKKENIQEMESDSWLESVSEPEEKKLEINGKINLKPDLETNDESKMAEIDPNQRMVQDETSIINTEALPEQKVVLQEQALPPTVIQEERKATEEEEDGFGDFDEGGALEQNDQKATACEKSDEKENKTYTMPLIEENSKSKEEVFEAQPLFKEEIREQVNKVPEKLEAEEGELKGHDEFDDFADISPKENAEQNNPPISKVSQEQYFGREDNFEKQEEDDEDEFGDFKDTEIKHVEHTEHREVQEVRETKILDDDEKLVESEEEDDDFGDFRQTEIKANEEKTEKPPGENPVLHAAEEHKESEEEDFGDFDGGDPGKPEVEPENLQEAKQPQPDISTKKPVREITDFVIKFNEI